MIAPSIVEEIKRLLASGKWSGRKIARKLGVSRGSVSAIARGRRPDYAAQREDSGEKAEPLGPLGRCGECGGMVHLPCRLCAVRKRLAGSKRRGRVAEAEECPRVELIGDERSRYEEILRQRLAAENAEE